jgi:Bacterial Ig-like domain (group 3)
MKTQTLQCTKVGKSMQELNSVSRSALCLLIASFSLASFSIAQTVGAATQSIATERHSIISLASSEKLSAETVARKTTDRKFENVPANYHVFPAASVGEVAGSRVLTLNFAGETTITRIQSTNKDFVIEPGGSCAERMSYARGESCSLVVRFNPQGPGNRLGLLKITNSAEAEPASFGLVGNGYAPVVSFRPSLITTVPGTLSSGAGTISNATSLAVDGGDIVYIADTGNNLVKKVDSSGTVTPAPNSPIATPASLTVDSFGILYTTNVTGATYYFSIYYPWGSETAYGYAHSAGTCTPSTPCAFSAVGMSSPAHISIDANDNLFFEEGTKGAAEMPVANIAGGSGSLNLWYLSDQFAYSSGTAGSFSVDANGNLYTNYTFATTGTCFLVQEPLYNAEYSPSANRVAGGVKCGFSGDGGQGRGAEISSTIGQIAFDIAGNLYFADAGNQRVRRIDATTGIIKTIAGNGTAGNAGDNGPATKATLRSPAGVAVDSQGQVYILSNTAATGTAQSVRKVGTTGALAFPSTTVAASSATLLVNVANTGNSVLNFVRNTLTGANAGDFSIDNNNTSCNFAAGNNLYAGQSCQIGVIFKPTAVGARTATLNLVDNTVNAINKVSLSGTAVAAAKVNFTSTASTQTTTGTKVSVSVKVTSPYSTPTGKVSFAVDGKVQTSAALSAATASAVVGPLTSGTHQLVAAYSGDKQHAAAKASKTLTVK